MKFNRPGRPTSLLKAVALLLLLIASGSMARFAYANPTTIVDLTPGTATVDGTIGPSEYAGFTEGINSGGGGIIGSNTALHIDSGGPLEELVFGLQLREDSQLLDYVVIYVDSVAGGLSDTTGLADTTDSFTKAVSGADQYGTAHLYFAPEFTADYAIAINYTGARLYQLVEGGAGSLNLIGAANLTPNNNSAASEYELSILMSDIGLTSGNAIKYVATLTHPLIPGFHRFNEFNGIRQTTYDADAAELQEDFNLASGDYHTFTTAGPTAVGLLSSAATLPPGSGFAPALPIFAALLAAGVLFLLRRRPGHLPRPG